MIFSLPKVPVTQLVDASSKRTLNISSRYDRLQPVEQVLKTSLRWHSELVHILVWVQTCSHQIPFLYTNQFLWQKTQEIDRHKAFSCVIVLTNCLWDEVLKSQTSIFLGIYRATSFYFISFRNNFTHLRVCHFLLHICECLIIKWN